MTEECGLFPAGMKTRSTEVLIVMSVFVLAGEIANQAKRVINIAGDGALPAIGLYSINGFAAEDRKSAKESADLTNHLPRAL